MGTTTRVKGDMDEKKPFNFALFWDKYGTFLSSLSSSPSSAPFRRSTS